VDHRLAVKPAAQVYNSGGFADAAAARQHFPVLDAVE